MKAMPQSVMSLLPILRCPYSGLPIIGNESGFHSEEQSYSMIDGILNFVNDEKVAAIDEFFQRQYGEKTAKSYDLALKLQSLLFGCWEPAERGRLARLLDPPRGGRLLEVSVGTGANLPHLAGMLGSGSEGEIVGVDLSLSMLKVAQKRAGKLPLPVHLIRGDGCHLPFADNSFDAVFHFGGINMFGDVKQGISEMVRVAKPGAPIVISDEGMSENRRRTWIGRRLGKMNTLNLCRPPFDKIPWVEVEGFELHWAWRELFYILQFRKGTGAGQHCAANSTLTTRDEIRRRVGGSTKEHAT